MSLFTSKMRLLSAVVLEEKSEAVARELLKLGLLDFIEISKLFDKDSIRLKSNNTSNSEISDLRRKLETIYQQVELDYPYRDILSVEEMTELKLSETRDTIEKISAELQKLRDNQKKLHQEKLKIEELIEYLSSSTGKKSPVSGFVNVHKGKPGRGVFEDMLNHLKSVPHFGSDIPDTDNHILISLRRDESVVNEVFRKYEWIENDVQSRSMHDNEILIGKMHKNAEKINVELNENHSEMKKIVLKYKENIDILWKNLRIHELYGTIKNNFSHTERTSLFSGWLPAEKSEQVETSIRNASDNNCIIEWSEPEQFKRESVPVEIRHSKALAPFQMLVENYATPEYGTIDPTIFVAVAYMIMFGLMFGDAGQGFIVVLIGIFGKILMKKASAGIKKLMQLFIYCGSASIVSGVLFGSYFGYKLFQPLWFDYHGVVSGHSTLSSGNINDVYDILRITIYFGIAVIGTGLIINWINLYRKRDFFSFFLDKSGIIGGWFYGCGVYTAFFFVANSYKKLPPGNLLTLFFGIPVIIMLFKAPLHFLLHERKHKSFTAFTLIDFFMEWVVELLEIFSGYLANTLSFMRVAGLGIAHVSLMVAFDTIAGMTHGAASIIILVFGNILVIALEGLSAGIQALRLNYYEFFSRYFTGKGIAYNPVSLRNRKQEG